VTPSLLNLLSAQNIVVFMLVFTRLTGLAQTAPFISSIQAPVMTKLWFCATIAFIFYPMVQTTNSFIIPKNMPEFIILIAIEFSIGYLVGFIANLIIEGARMTGSVLSIQMGLSMSEALDPATGVSATEISRLYVYLATLILIATGAYQFLFIAIFNSFNAIPMGVVPLLDSNMTVSLIQLFAQSFKIAFAISLPIFSVLLISDILIGMMNGE